MDPDVCLAELIEAARFADWDSVRDHLEDLAEWLRKGGYPFDVGRVMGLLTEE